MITKEVKKFMTLAPLLVPGLIDTNRCEEPDITEDSTVLGFRLEEPLPLACIMDMLDNDMDMLLLYHGTSKSDPKLHHCCMFSNPIDGKSMYMVNIISPKNEMADSISVTIFNSIDIWESELEDDLKRHELAFDFIMAMKAEELAQTFCKIGHED